MKPSTKKFLIKLNKDILAISMISFVVLFFLELIKPKFVIAYINLNYILLLCLASGIFAVLFEDQTQIEENNIDNSETEKIGKSMLLIFSIATFIFIMFFTRDLGAWGVLVGLIGGLVAFLLGLTLG